MGFSVTARAVEEPGPVVKLGESELVRRLCEERVVTMTRAGSMVITHKETGESKVLKMWRFSRDGGHDIKVTDGLRERHVMEMFEREFPMKVD